MSRVSESAIARQSTGPLSPRDIFGSQPTTVVVAIGMAVIVGSIAAVPNGLIYLAITCAAAGAIVLALKPRVALLALVVALPFAALPGILLQQTGWPTLLKDLLLILPLYVGVVGSGALARFPELPLPVRYAVIALTAVVVVMSIRPLLETPLVALVGVKTWLWYVPLVLVPFVCIRDWTDCWRILRTMVVVAPLPGMVAIVEASLIYGGHQATVYGWYGSLASSVTQQFALVNISNSILVVRIPSTFDFPAQFFGFSLAMLPTCLCVAVADPLRRWRVMGAVATAVVVVGGSLSGARSFLVLLPLDLVLIAVLIKQLRTKVVFVSAIAVMTLMIVTAPIDLGDVAAFLSSLGNFYLVNATAMEFREVMSATGALGMGIGTQTGASRYVINSNSTLGIGIEGGYAIVFYEVGAFGLITVLSVWAALIGHLAMVRRRLPRPGQVVVSLVLVLVISTVINLIKGPYLNLDPLNVYFWLLVGIAVRLPTLPPPPAFNERD